MAPTYAELRERPPVPKSSPLGCLAWCWGYGLPLWAAAFFGWHDVREGRAPWLLLAMIVVPIIALIIVDQRKKPKLPVRPPGVPETARYVILRISTMEKLRLTDRGWWFVEPGGAWWFEGPSVSFALRAADLTRGVDGWRLADTDERISLRGLSGKPEVVLPAVGPGAGYGLRPPHGTNLRESPDERRNLWILLTGLAPLMAATTLFFPLEREPAGGRLPLTLGILAMFVLLGLTGEWMFRSHRRMIAKARTAEAERARLADPSTAVPPPEESRRRAADGG